jgi:hypothetical protein
MPLLAPRAGGVLSRPANRLPWPQVQPFVSVVDRKAVALFQSVRRAFGRDFDVEKLTANRQVEAQLAHLLVWAE